MIPHLDRLNAGTNGLYDTGALMTRDYRHRVRRRTGYNMPVAVANASRLHANEDFATLRWLELKALDCERLLRAVKNGC